MSKEPILILQMQRMGDLILSFPLLLWLQRLFPGHPLWLVAEEVFFKGLLPVAPEVTFFPSTALKRLKGNSFHLVINLSHRPEAAALGPHIKTEQWIGPRQNAQEHTYIHGQWQLYRASLTHNNRHNRYHWTDLNLLDIVPYTDLSQSGWPAPAWPAANPKNSLRPVGLFLGASEAAKHPDATFWAELVTQLQNRGFVPALLGGKQELRLGTKVAHLTGTPQLNFCDRFDLPEFVNFTNSLQLLITPDTGPMHLAAWLGIPTLNLSLGPVNPWDTGPYQPGHLVLRSSLSCRGCWHCTQSKLLCHSSFSAARLAVLVKSVLSKSFEKHAQQEVATFDLPSQELFDTNRQNGLYFLRRLSGPSTPNRNALAAFWQTFFGCVFGLWPENRAKLAWQALQNNSPELARPFAKNLQVITKEIAVALKTRQPLASNFWEKYPQLFRPLSSYLNMLLQNEDYSREGCATALNMLDFFAALTENSDS